MFYKLSKSLWLAVFWSAIIFFLLSIPGKDLPQAPRIPHLDKIIHTILFAVLCCLWCCVWRARAKQSSLLVIILVCIILCSAYGIGMEYYQKYCVANRSFEMKDIYADTAGSVLGGLIAFRSIKRQVI